MWQMQDVAVDEDKDMKKTFGYEPPFTPEA
jgi:hypothetical protein